MNTTHPQHWNPDSYKRNASFVSALGEPLLELLNPQAGERILDVGCGDGALAAQLANTGCRVVGVDASDAMVQAALAAGVEAQVMDGQNLQFGEVFDAVLTNAALHWMPRTSDVMGGVWRCLRPGGRFVGECGGFGNVAQIVSALQSNLTRRGLAYENPWTFLTAEQLTGLLQAQGFHVNSVALFPRPTRLPGDVSGWLETFAQVQLRSLHATVRRRVIASVVEELRPQMCAADGHWWADYVRLRFDATKPAPT